MRRLASLSLLLPLLATPALATTWVVDDDGGAGVDFPDIASATVAALPGDTIVVLPGSYGPFVLTEGLTIVAPSGAAVSGLSSITGLPAGKRALLSGLQVEDLLVSQCEASVILDNLRVVGHAYYPEDGVVRVLDSRDVRFRRCVLNPSPVYHYEVMPALFVDSSRVELTGCTLRGDNGDDAPSSSGEPGGRGTHALVMRRSEVHVSHSTLRGGHGGSGAPGHEFGHGPGGAGGHGIRAEEGSILHLTGSSVDEVLGGGHGSPASFHSPGGDGLNMEGTPAEPSFARMSGVTLLPGSVDFAAGRPIGLGPYAAIDAVQPADPFLTVAGSQAPGGTATLRLHGTPGFAARLRLGRAATVASVQGCFEDRLIAPLRTFSLGELPPSGTVELQIGLGASLPPGTVLFVQGSVTAADGATELSQSLPLVVR